MGILRRLMGLEARKVPPAQPSPAKLMDLATTVASAYGDVLQSEDCPIPGVSTADVSKLPYPKEDIKASLQYILKQLPPGYLRNQTENAYLLLAGFQEGVGQVNTGISSSFITAPVDEANVDSFASGLTAGLTAQERWSQVVSQDLAQLQDELEQLRKKA